MSLLFRTTEWLPSARAVGGVGGTGPRRAALLPPLRQSAGPPLPVEPMPPSGTVYAFEVLALGASVIGLVATVFIPIDPMRLVPGRLVQTLVTAFATILSLRLAEPVWTWWRYRHAWPPGTLLRLVRRSFSRRYVSFVVRCVVAVQVVLLWFCVLKYMLPLVRPFSADAALARLDGVLHGISPNILLVVPLQDWPGLLGAVDLIYAGYFPLLVCFTTYVLVQNRRPDLRARFITGYCVLWLLGGLAYYVAPAMGPCYYAPALFSRALEHMPVARMLQEQLLADCTAFVDSPWTHRPQLYYGIAAMPSLHVAALAYFAMIARHFGPRLCAATWIATWLTFVGSIITGWHYAVDAYAGVALAAVAYAAAMRIEPSIGFRPAVRATILAPRAVPG